MQSPLGHAVTRSPSHPKHAELRSASSQGPWPGRAGVGKTEGCRSEANPSRLLPPGHLGHTAALRQRCEMAITVPVLGGPLG